MTPLCASSSACASSCSARAEAETWAFVLGAGRKVWLQGSALQLTSINSASTNASCRIRNRLSAWLRGG